MVCSTSGAPSPGGEGWGGGAGMELQVAIACRGWADRWELGCE